MSNFVYSIKTAFPVYLQLSPFRYLLSPLNGLKTKSSKRFQKYPTPPNCPELRHIERYWALLKNAMKATNKQSLAMQDFENKWKITTKTGSEGTEKALIEGIQE